MVLDDGNLVEFDSPASLLELENGFFRALVNKSDDRELLMRVSGLGE